MLHDKAIMQYYHTCIDSNQFPEAISYLLNSGVPPQKEYWEFLSKHLEHQTELQLFCQLHAQIPLKESDVPNNCYLDIIQQLPHPPSLIELYIHASIDERSKWNINQEPDSWEDIVWRIPILLHENKTDLMFDWIARYEQESIEATVTKQLLEHLHKREFLDFFCGIYLWKKTWGQRSTQLMISLGNWCIHCWKEENFSLASKALFLSLISMNERMILADKLQVHIYDIEEHAFFSEIEAKVIERNRGKHYSTAAQSLYSIVPIIDDLGTDATDSKIALLYHHIQQNPNDDWAKASLLYLASQAQSISSEYMSEALSIKEKLFARFPRDKILACYDEHNKSREKWSAILPCKAGYRALAYLFPEDKQVQTLLAYYTGTCEQKGSITPFFIQEKNRAKREEVVEPSLIQVLIPTTIFFALGIWVLGTILSYLQ